MQRKLKAVFRSSSRKSDREDGESEASSPRSTRGDRRATSLDEQRRRQSADAYRGPQHNSRSRPLSSAYDSGRPSGSNTFDFAQSDNAHEAIANDYKAYLPVLSPVDDSNDKEHMTLGGDRRLITGESDGRHEEDVADRNIDRYRRSLDVSRRKPLPATPVVDTPDQDYSRKQSTGAGSFGSALSASPSAKYVVGRDVTTKGGLQDSILPHSESNMHGHGSSNKSARPPKIAQEESMVGWSRRKPRGSDSDDDAPRGPPEGLRSRAALDVGSTTIDGQHKIQKEIEELLDGVVDLRDTVDEDKDVRWAPAVVHEVIKPHEHEIIQHRIFREIHNYEYYHRIQPVYDIEVLPPRHWIPNPNGEGLIEISADELPSRTGNNRRWKIIHEQVEPSADSGSMWRTEPAIIEHPTQITDEGFERKETTIIYPPKLADMTEYDGLVQPVHFDHKTGKRWLGPISTMHQIRKEIGAVADPDLSMRELAENLPETPEESDVSELSQSPGLRRKPLHGEVPAHLSRHDGIAVAV